MQLASNNWPKGKDNNWPKGKEKQENIQKEETQKEKNEKGDAAWEDVLRVEGEWEEDSLEVTKSW